MVNVFTLFLALALPQGDAEAFLLRNGDTLRAEVVRLDGDRAVLRIHFDGGAIQDTRPLADFQPHSAYLIQRRTLDPQNVEHVLRLARFAADHGLVWVAQRDLERARELAGDPALATDLAKVIEDRGAAVLADLFHTELQIGNLHKARRLLSELFIRFPDSEPAQQRDALLTMLADAEQRTVEEKRIAEATVTAARLDDARQKVFRAIDRHVELGSRENLLGLRTSKQFAAAHQHFQSAAHHFERALRGITDALEKGDADATLAAGLQDRQRKAMRLYADALLNAGSVCLVRSQFGKALGHVNKVLAMDPNNPEARAMRARIELAASTYGYGYGIGVRRYGPR